jgi:CDP-glucose 4,6-dehydratase
MEDLELTFDGAFRGRRVLVTGDTGFKGSWLAAWLHALGAEVHGLALPPATEPSHFQLLRLPTRIRHADGDLRNLDTVRASLRSAQPELVLHLAAQALVRPSYDDPKGTFDTNVGGTVNLLEAVRETPAVRAVVVVTSDKCYDNREWDFAYRENDPLGGRDPYAASKAAAELVVAAYRASFFQGPQRTVGVATTRAGNVIGGGDWATDRLVPDCVRALAAGKPVLIRNPRSVRPWQHVLEPLCGYLQLAAALLRDPNSHADAFNFGPVGADTLPAQELAELFLEGWGGGSIELAKTSAGQPHEAGLLKLSSEKAMARLGFRPLLDVREAVRWTVEWYRGWHEDRSGTGTWDRTAAQLKRYVDRAREARLSWAVTRH